MRTRLMIFAAALLLITAGSPRFLRAQSAATTPQSGTAAQLTAMLNQFLHDASVNNADGFDTFFADDVIYTRSTGGVTNKADIMRSMRTVRPAAQSQSNAAVYSAEDVTVHDYGDTAVVAFRLVSRATHADGATDQSSYRNTGVFLRRNGKWQVVAWQSTKIPAAAPGR
jgi:ketosteroid isomerase-like protein